MNIWIGIDPGFEGAVGVLRGSVFSCDVFDVPVVGEGPDKRVDSRGLWCELDAHRRGDGADDGTLWHACVAIEKAQPMPKQGISSAFRYGACYGALRAICEDLDFRVVLVPPGTWKGTMGLRGKGKDASRELAMRLFPDLRGVLARKKDHNRAEAILLAEWLRRQEGEIS